MSDDQALLDSPSMLNHLLLKASQDSNIESLHICIQQGAFLETRRPFAVTPELGLNPDGGPVGLTPLMYSAQNGAAVACRMLLEARACVNAEDEDSLTPLHFAASSGSVKACRVLLEYRADVGVRDVEGREAFEMVSPAEMMRPEEKLLWRSLLRPGTVAANIGQGGSAEGCGEDAGWAEEEDSGEARRGFGATGDAGGGPSGGRPVGSRAAGAGSDAGGGAGLEMTRPPAKPGDAAFSEVAPEPGAEEATVDICFDEGMPIPTRRTAAPAGTALTVRPPEHNSDAI